MKYEWDIIADTELITSDKNKLIVQGAAVLNGCGGRSSCSSSRKELMRQQVRMMSPSNIGET